MRIEPSYSRSHRASQWLAGFLLFMVFTAMRPSERIVVYVEAELEEDEHSRGKNKDVLDSVKDLKNQIEKRGGIMLAEERSSADIVITVLDRRIDVAQDRQTHWGGGHIQNQYMSRYVIVYLFEAVNDSHRAEQMAYGSLVTWKSVASNLSKHIEGWARENRAQLLAWRHRKTTEK
jgi:hypothetical protein